MSEFSESWHLRTMEPQEAVKLLEQAERRGYVFEEENGWVTFVADGSSFQSDPQLISLNPGLLIHYIYAEDHGWELGVYKRDQRVFEYKCDWSDGEIVVESSGFEAAMFAEFVDAPALEELEALFLNEHPDEIFQEEPAAYRCAYFIGLVHVDWISFDYIAFREQDQQFKTKIRAVNLGKREA